MLLVTRYVFYTVHLLEKSGAKKANMKARSQMKIFSFVSACASEKAEKKQFSLRPGLHVDLTYVCRREMQFKH